MALRSHKGFQTAMQIYSNWQCVSAEHVFMFFCSEKKAQYYLQASISIFDILASSLRTTFSLARQSCISMLIACISSSTSSLLFCRRPRTLSSSPSLYSSTYLNQGVLCVCSNAPLFSLSPRGQVVLTICTTPPYYKTAAWYV